jgi:hypothetical protein
MPRAALHPTQGPRGVVVKFPVHTVAVRPDGNGGWLVCWRSWCWVHGSHESAVNDAWAIARAHNVRVVEQ